MAVWHEGTCRCGQQVEVDSFSKSHLGHCARQSGSVGVVARERNSCWVDSAYAGQWETIRSVAPNAKDFTQKKRSRYRKLSDTERSKNRSKSKVRTRGEQPFLVVKQVFGFSKVRYRGLMKNGHRFMTVCGLANLYLVCRKLVPMT